MVREQTGPKRSTSGMSMFIIEVGVFCYLIMFLMAICFVAYVSLSGEVPSEMERIKLKPITKWN